MITVITIDNVVLLTSKGDYTEKKSKDSPLVSFMVFYYQFKGIIKHNSLSQSDSESTANCLTTTSSKL